MRLAAVKARGHSTLAVSADEHGTIFLSLLRDEKPVLSHIRLPGLKVGKETVNAGTLPTNGEAPPGKAIPLENGASLRVECHSFLDAFEVVVQGSPESPSVEAQVLLEELGPCFGAGHLMRQPWPLQDGALELGPFYVRFLYRRP